MGSILINVDQCNVVSWCTARFHSKNPVGIYKFKVNNRNTRTRCETSSKLTIKTPEQWQWHHSGVFIVNFEHISIVNFERANVGWVNTLSRSTISEKLYHHHIEYYDSVLVIR